MSRIRFFQIALTGLFFIALNTLFAQEPAAEQAAEPARPIPCVDHPETLRPLDPADPIWVTPDRKQAVLVGTICLREGMLEFFACRKNSKEHESIVSLDIKPYLIHAALLVIGAKKGSPARFSPDFIPPSGEEIEIRLRWKNADGAIQDFRAQELVREAASGSEMTSPWVFTGGVMKKDPDGKKSYYLADVTGEIIGVSNFAGTVLDVPFESTSNNEALLFEPFTERIPEIGTEVTLIFSGTGNFHTAEESNTENKSHTENESSQPSAP